MTFPASLPAPRTPDPREAPPLRWAVLGPGWIASRFVGALQRHTVQEVVAVGSRDLGRSREFADRFDIATAAGSYLEAIERPDVDIVYVATPHPWHAELAIAAMRAGKHVLIEKPMATNAVDAQRIVEVAEATGRYCCEALWTMFLPKWDVLRQVVDSGSIGRIRSVSGEYGEWFTEPHRNFEPDLAGGPLLDIGIYPLSMITSLVGAPDEVTALGIAHPTGVTGQLAATMTHPGEVLSTLTTSLYGELRNELRIVGTEGVLVVEPLHNSPGSLSVRSADGSVELRHDAPASDHLDGLHFQAVEAARRIAAGETQSPHRTLESSMVTLRALDQIAGLTEG